MNHRRRKRSRGHADAERHAGQHGHGRPSFEHALVPAGDPELIVDAKALDAFLEHARGHSTIAFDTEFIGEESFRPRICLVQLATTERVALVDPLVVKSLKPLWDFVADPSVLTIVHAGEQDVEAVRAAIDRQPLNLVDTQVAASLVGFPWPTSLGTMIERLIDHRPAKAHTFTNWDARPLTPSQLRYAADDVRYLPLAWSLIDAELRRRGRLEWALRESQEVLEGDLVFNPARQVRRAARGEPLRPAALTALRELVLLRHELARRADLPPRAVLPDAVAVELVKRHPSTRSQLAEIRGLPRPTLTAFGEEILKKLEQAKELPIERDGRAKILDDATVRAEIDALWLAMQAKCFAMGLAPTLVVSRADFTEWCAARIAARRRRERPVDRDANGSAERDANGSAERDGAEGKGDAAGSLFDHADWRHKAVGEWLERFERGEDTLHVGFRAGLVDAGAAEIVKASISDESPTDGAKTKAPRTKSSH